MNMVDGSSLLTTIFVLVDDWYQEKGFRYVPSMPGPASTDERLAAESVLHCVHGCHILADKGFIGGEWQSDISKTTGNQIFTPKRANQLQQHAICF
nr:hypothetical protein [Nostoc sp. 'Peltigera membranacea cyanobiont' N6]